MVDTLRPIEEANMFKAEAGRATAAAGAATAAAKPAPQKLWVRLPSADDPRMKRIELILTMFPGQQQLVIYCEREKKKLVARCLIHEALVDELKEMLGNENVVLK